MNTTSLSLHLIRKDIRAFRFLWILLWLVAIGIALLPVGKEAAYPALLTGASFVLLFLIQTRFLQLDPAGGTEAFLSTRPVPRSMVFATKAVSFFVLGLLPVLLAIVIQAALLRLDLSARDYIWLCERNLLMWLGYSGLLALAACYTRNLAQLIAVTVALWALLAFVMFSTIRVVTSASMSPVAMDVHGLGESRRALAFALCGVTGYAVVLTRYRHRDGRRQIFSGAVGAILVVVCLKFLPFSVFPRAVAMVPGPAVLAAALENVTVQPVTNRIRYMRSSSNGGSSKTVNQTAIIHGLPEPYILSPVGWQAVAHLPQGSTFSAARNDSYIGLPKLKKTVGTLLNIPSDRTTHPSARLAEEWSLTVFTYDTAKLPSDVRTAAITGRWDFDVYESSLVAEFPIEKGVVFSGGGCRIEITGVRLEDGNLVLAVQTLTFSRPRRLRVLGLGAAFDFGEYSAFIANPTHGQFPSKSGSSSRGGSTFSFFEGQQQTVDFSVQTESGQKQRITADWLRHARLYVIRSKRVASFSRSFELKDVPLDGAEE